MLKIEEKNILLIMPNSVKKTYLKSISTLLSTKIMTLEEFIKKYYFDYDNEAIFYLMKKYNYKYDVAKKYIDNLYYVELKEYKSLKLNKLVEIKKELIENNLLIENKLFKEYIKEKKIVVYGYDYIENKYNDLLEQLNAEFVEDNKVYDNQLIYEFNKKEEEIDFLISNIIELKENNVSLNNIKIVRSEYDKKIKEKFINLNINFNEKINIYSTNIVKIFLDNLSNNIEETIEILKNKIDLSNEINFKIYNKIINILNNNSFTVDYLSIREIIEEELKKEEIIINNYKEKIEFISIENNLTNENDHVFLLGFNKGEYPITVKDESYITDNIKEEVKLDKTFIINKKKKKALINKIKNINNLIMTYNKEKDKTVSSLNETLKIEIIKDYKIPYYINIENKMKLVRKLDLLRKYNHIDKDIDLLYGNYKDINYNSYDNSFTGINIKNNNLLLSYSSMDNYYKCGFKYYIENILKLNVYEEQFANVIGNIFHNVLKDAFSENFNFELTYNNYLNSLKREFNDKELLFLNNLKEELKEIIKVIKKQYELISFDKALYEEKIYVSKNANVTFMGIIDKLMYKTEEDRCLVAIIDYKTGNPNLNLNNMIYGLDMQLPIYLYLATNTNKLKNVEIVGFYLQKVLNKELQIKPNKTLADQREDNLKLQGYSIDNVNLLEKFDKSYMDSRLIKSMKIGNNGFNAYAKILNKEKIDKIIKLVDKKIEEASISIKEGKFNINPKVIKDKNISCEFCKYKDICYKKPEDIIYLKEYKNLEFL